MKIWSKRILVFLLILLVAIGIFVVYATYFTVPSPPYSEVSIPLGSTADLNSDVRKVDASWTRKDSIGLWEMYVTGTAIERGRNIGIMTEDILETQERAFVNQLKTYVPNGLYRKFLLASIKYYNRNIAEYILEEFQQEIYGVSQSMPDAFDDLGDKYQRKLMYHAAHDIGHAFQNLGLVSGCSAVSVKDSFDQVYLGRNFDFYVGDEFAQNKVVLALRPESGYPFLSISWPGMMGVVSAMNIEGLAIALNAGPAQIPDGVATPVTILAREIVQYARTVDEAIRIAKKRDVFVAENFIVASSLSNEIVVIEKSPGNTSIHVVDAADFICTNHFLSNKYDSDSDNLKAKNSTSTQYRYDRIKQLHSSKKNNLINLVDILRDRKGQSNNNLGFENEMAVNQVIGHHSVIFDLKNKNVYLAGVNHQLGPYFRYNLDSIFNWQYQAPQRLWLDAIPGDSVINTSIFNEYKLYRHQKTKLTQVIVANDSYSIQEADAFVRLNPDHYEPYLLCGKYFIENGDCINGMKYLIQVKNKPVPWLKDKQLINELIRSCE